MDAGVDTVDKHISQLEVEDDTFFVLRGLLGDHMREFLSVVASHEVLALSKDDTERIYSDITSGYVQLNYRWKKRAVDTSL